MLTTTDMPIGNHVLRVSTTGDPKSEAVLWLSNWERVMGALVGEDSDGLCLLLAHRFEARQWFGSIVAESGRDPELQSPSR